MILVRHLDLKFLNELAAAMNRNFKSAALVAAGNGEVRLALPDSCATPLGPDSPQAATCRAQGLAYHRTSPIRNDGRVNLLSHNISA